ncbi:MAG: ribulose-phosphate 3-epimerase [Candidatus Hodarchaeota archaeon]
MKKIALSVHAGENFSIEALKGLTDIDFIHIDVMDGLFVDNVNLNLDIFKIIKKKSNIPIIAHMMVVNPSYYVPKIINYIDAFLFHFEVEEDKLKVIHQVRKYNKKVGLVLNPETKVTEIASYLNYVDLFLILGVHPGWSGQKFIPDTINKVNKLASYKQNYNFEIDVDGGINLKVAKLLKNADILTSSTTILNAKDPNRVVSLLKNFD